MNTESWKCLTPQTRSSPRNG